MRINKFLAMCGVASRRNSDDIILEGRVRINGRVLKECGKDINPDKDIITVDGKRVEPIEEHLYLMLNKPKGYVCTVKDDKGRKTVLDLFKNYTQRLFPVGRLDYDTEGLLLMTTDGQFANAVMHPSNGISKTYAVRIAGTILEAELNTLRDGVVLDGEKTSKCKVYIKNSDTIQTRLEVVISEGRNRQIRRMFEAIGKEILFLKRTAIGDLKLGGLSRGASRALTDKELSRFLPKKETGKKN